MLCFSKPVLAAKRAKDVETGSSNLKTLSLTTPVQQQATLKIRDEKELICSHGKAVRAGFVVEQSSGRLKINCVSKRMGTYKSKFFPLHHF